MTGDELGERLAKKFGSMKMQAFDVRLVEGELADALVDLAVKAYTEVMDDTGWDASPGLRTAIARVVEESDPKPQVYTN